MKLRASGNGITLQDNSLPYATGPYMIGSPTHIRRIIINLLDNIIKYNKRGGFRGRLAYRRLSIPQFR